MNAISNHDSTLGFAAPQRFSRTLRFGLVTTDAPPPCALTRFSASLSNALSADGVEADVVGLPAGRAGLDQFDVVLIQHALGVGDQAVVDIVNGLLVPSIVVAHTIPKHPKPHQRSVLEGLAAGADHVVVMSEAARQRLCLGYAVDRRKVSMIPHGATIPNIPRLKRPSRPTILTWGLLGPGRGIERVIDAMPSLSDVPGRPRYLVAGPTHPQILATDGEAYREARIEQARRRGVADSVVFDSDFYDGARLTALIQQSSVVVVPYDSTEQVTSGVLVDAVANGRPIVATAFPHAVELLSSGAGMVVDHDDAGAMASALRQIVTQPRLAGTMAAEARQRAPEMAWPVVAGAYAWLARRLLADRKPIAAAATQANVAGRSSG